MSSILQITGYVNVVERDSEVIRRQIHPNAPGSFVERVKAGAFRLALSGTPDIALMVDHRRRIGSTLDGTLHLKEDGIGLKASCQIRDEEIIQAAREHRIRGWSFGFSDPIDEWIPQENGLYRRYLKHFLLHEVSIVIDRKPAYAATSMETVDGTSILVETRSAHTKSSPLLEALAGKGLLMRTKII